MSEARNRGQATDQLQDAAQSLAEVNGTTHSGVDRILESHRTPPAVAPPRRLAILALLLRDESCLVLRESQGLTGRQARQALDPAITPFLA